MAMSCQEYLSDVKGCIQIAFVLAVVQGVIMEAVNVKIMSFARSRPWWPQAMPLQKALMMNFGFPESMLDEETTLDSYAFVLVFCGHHIIAGSMMVPVAICGWEGAGPTGQLLFLLAGVGDVGLDVFDWVKTFCLTFFPNVFKFWGARKPLTMFIILCCLHHPLAMSMMIPMMIYHPTLKAFHYIAVALLLAAGICFTTGAYKFTLNTKTRSGFLQYKAIVVIQLVTVWSTRGYVWFTQVYAALTTFRAQGDTIFFVGGCVAAGVMSLFNLIMLMDSLDAAKKWLPRPMPQLEDECKALRHDIIRHSSSQQFIPVLLLTGLSPAARQFHASGTTLLAAAKFKKALKKEN